MVGGPSASGKSAMCANGVQVYTDAHPRAVVVVHYTGSSAADSDKLEMILRRIIEGVSTVMPKEQGKRASSEEQQLWCDDSDSDLNGDGRDGIRTTVMPWEAGFNGFDGGWFRWDDYAAMAGVED